MGNENESGLYDQEDRAGMNHTIILAAWHSLCETEKRYMCFALGEDYQWYLDFFRENQDEPVKD